MVRIVQKCMCYQGWGSLLIVAESRGNRWTIKFVYLYQVGNHILFEIFFSFGLLQCSPKADNTHNKPKLSLCLLIYYTLLMMQSHWAHISVTSGTAASVSVWLWCRVETTMSWVGPELEIVILKKILTTKGKKKKWLKLFKYSSWESWIMMMIRWGGSGKISEERERKSMEERETTWSTALVVELGTT